jgi:hypothetical protein
MKITYALAALVLLLAPTLCLAQSDRINERLPGTQRLNERAVPEVSGRYGPDPYLGSGAVSPFAKSPPIPMRSAPLGNERNSNSGSPFSCESGRTANGECKQ